MFWECSELGIFMFWTGNSMNYLLSYCGLVDAEKRASDIDVPVQKETILSFAEDICRKRSSISSSYPESWFVLIFKPMQ